MNKIWISTGKSIEETNWKNVEMTWDTLAERLRKPVVTKELYAEYLKMSKDKQSAIKDVGGFVGGILQGGRRKKTSVTARYLLALDIDTAPLNFYDQFTLLFDCEAVVYSTHKHSAELPRFRLVIPLAREVFTDEHEAIARKVAGTLGIQYFDPTTFQAERLMFWPSVSSDMKLYYQRQKGKWLDPDAVLAEYADWRDTSQWPMSVQEKKRVRAGIDKQEDPHAKKGLVGVFCRTYSISAAIDKFLSDVYEPTSHEDRYTFSAGTTSAGMITYDDKFSLSYHSTDPTEGRLCNAFDLVRIHLYGESDDRADEKTPLVKKPSYGKMLELITADGEVRKNLLKERADGKMSSGVIDGSDFDEDDGEWKKKLEMDKKGNVLQTIANVVTIMENDPQLKDNLYYDDLTKLPTLRRNMPWRKIGKYSNELIDSDDAGLRNYLEIMYAITHERKINDAVEIVIHKNIIHPIKIYLEDIQWDGVPRLETILVDYLGAQDSTYVREVTRKTFVAAIARIYEPGIKFDTVLTLVGPQGIGKSRLVHKMFGEWYSDTFGSLNNNGAMENIQGIWGMEIGELAGLKRQELEAVKLFISKQTDRFRVAFGKRVQKFPRQCVFIGTTNNDEFLQDQTGNRRWWPVQVGVNMIDLGKGIKGIEALSSEIVSQVWAEACYLYTMGENLYLDNVVEGMAKVVQEEYTEKDDRKKMIIDYLDLKIPANWDKLALYDRQAYINGDTTICEEPYKDRDYITIPEIWLELMKGTVKEMSSFNTKYIRNIMNKMEGWAPKLINRKPYGTQRGWAKVDLTEKSLAANQ